MLALFASPLLLITFCFFSSFSSVCASCLFGSSGFHFCFFGGRLSFTRFNGLFFPPASRFSAGFDEEDSDEEDEDDADEEDEDDDDDDVDADDASDNPKCSISTTMK